jgi:activating signal cointegrator 1
MKMITIPQPWATLVALGLKTILTRPDPTTHIGPVAIWSAQTAPVIEDPYIHSVLSTAGYTMDTLPLGIELARAQLVDCRKIRNADIPCYPEYAFGEFKEGWYAWYLADITCYKTKTE